jgi:fatty acid kinase fatty acid binding subunit
MSGVEGEGVMTVRVVTDSNTMIPADLARALSIIVVPLTVTIGDDEYVEDEHLDVAAVYGRLRAGAPASTSAPSPGVFAAAYAALAASPVVSVHIGAAYSATLDAARLGARTAGIDVDFVDTANVSFLAGCCVVAAAEIAAAGGTPDDVVAAASSTARDVASVFTIAELDGAGRSGRLDTTAVPAADGTPVLHVRGSDIETVSMVRSAEEAADVMFEHIMGIDGPLVLGVGDADGGAIVDDLADRLRRDRPGDRLIRYVVGPSVAAHAGMGTFGVVYASRAT